MKRRILSILLTLAMIVSLTVTSASAAPAAPSTQSANAGAHYFYDQLNATGKAIYNAMWDMAQRGLMDDGRSSYDLVERGVVSQAGVKAYLDGDRSLFNAFAAAKDAFDLDHSEIWYLDSSYLTFRVAQDSLGQYHAYLGPGRGDDYYVSGVSGEADALIKTAAVEQVIDGIVEGAERAAGGGLTSADAAARTVQYVHDEIIRTISYRYETECMPGNEGYVRTLYALVTHEGVCEAYARAMQVILTRLGIPCVLIHGLQTSGDAAEMHMWNAVQIGGAWYAVDATWDDPVRLNAQGGIITSSSYGLDGGEMDTYLLVGQDVIGANWVPSGSVSTGSMTFDYPQISQRSYDGERAFQNAEGLEVAFRGTTVEGVTAGQWTASFKDMGVRAAAKQGFYFLVKMQDHHPDGTIHAMDDWYYVEAGLLATEGNPYFTDSSYAVQMSTATCEYAEFAITTRAPDSYFGNWSAAISSTRGEAGFYHGDGSDIIARSDLLYNPNSDYEAPPYVSRQYPASNTQIDISQTYRVHVEFDDVLRHPLPNGSNIEGRSVDGNQIAQASQQQVEIQYQCYQQDRNGNTKVHHLDGRVNFDTNRDMVVDPGSVTWLYRCDQRHTHSPETCDIYGVEFDFAASSNWSDDSTLYSFSIAGLVGSRSGKAPNSWGYVMSTPSCPSAYRSQGIDWNLWGQPSLLDNPDDLDLSRLAVEGVDGSRQSLADLQRQMNVDDMNGRLMLVVEDLSEGAGSREKYEELTSAFDRYSGVNESAVEGSSLYEINFTRLCRQTVVLNGESVRMQVGFPKGFDANSNVVYKAYHFTRNAAGEIISVEEIPLTVTPYGLVVLCDSFSPFEIVALNPAQAGESAVSSEKSIVVVAEPGGTVYLNDGRTPATGASSFFTLRPGESVTLYIQPDIGYVTGSVAINGTAYPLSANGQLTIRHEDLTASSSMVSASFLARSVYEEDLQHNMTESAPNANVPGSSGTVPGTPGTSGNQGYPGGGTQWPPQASAGTYSVIVASPVNGTVRAGSASAQVGTRVSLTVTPGSGYELESLKVTTSSGQSVKPAATYRGIYSFLMPADHVAVSATFRTVTPLVNLPFTDVPVNAWYYPSVQYSFSRGMVSGTTASTFEPGRATTRGQFAVMLWRMCGSPVSQTAAKFRDVSLTDYFYQAAAWASEHGIINGYEDGTFRPNVIINREQIVSILRSLAGAYGWDTSLTGTVDMTKFRDTNNISSWAKENMTWACEVNLVGGDNYGRLLPTENASRAQVCAVLYNYSAIYP